MNRKTLSALLALLIVATLVLAACGGAEECPDCPECPEAADCPECPEAAECPECPEGEARQDILGTVTDRGKVVCGSRTDLLGFGYLDETGNNVGFDIDLCRAVATALFNDPEAVEFVFLTAAERGPALQTGEIDLLSRNVTWTSSRDVQWGDFTTVMFYDGQGMMVREDSGFTQLEDLDGATVCVTTGTTTEKNLADAFRQRGLDFEAVTFEDTSAVYSAFEDGRCDATTSDKSQLAAVREGFADPDAYVIMDVTMSKEPLTPAVPTGSDKWFDVVKTVMYLLVNAEELGVTQANVDEMLNSDNIAIRRLPGVEGSFGQEDLGLAVDFGANVLRAVGNYGEVYDRYMGPDGDAFELPRGLNKLWTDGGLIYAPPLK